jgi:DNA-directed RNA polymerase specialized sigma24 family protein
VSSLSDAQALRRCRRDPEAICVLYDRHVARLVAGIAYACGDRETAFDIAQETFAPEPQLHLSLWRRDRQAARRGWLLRRTDTPRGSAIRRALLPKGWSPIFKALGPDGEPLGEWRIPVLNPTWTRRPAEDPSRRSARAARSRGTS